MAHHTLPRRLDSLVADCRSQAEGFKESLPNTSALLTAAAELMIESMERIRQLEEGWQDAIRNGMALAESGD